MSSNIPASPAYGVFISQLIRYTRACSSYGCFILRATRLSNKPLEQGYVKERLKSSLKKFYGRYGDLVKQYEVLLSSLTNAKWHSVAWPITLTTIHRSDFIPIRDLFTELDLLPAYERYPLNICDGCSILTGDAYSSGHLGSSHLVLAYVLLVETNPFLDLVVILPDYALRMCLWYCLDFASYKSYAWVTHWRITVPDGYGWKWYGWFRKNGYPWVTTV